MKKALQHTAEKIWKAILPRGPFLAIFICCLQLLQAAIDPVTVIVTLSPPYTPFIGEYAPAGTGKLQVTLIVNDGRMLNYPAKLEMFIERADRGGTVMQTSEYSAIPPIMLTGQTTEILTGADLAPYFQARNNIFTGFDQSQYISTGRIPDGMYRIGFRVVDAQRSGVTLSNIAYSQPGWFLLNDPPYLNLPRDKEEQRISEPQSLKLEWFPRHVGSMNSAFATSYEVELYPIRVPGMDPNQVALSLQPSYTETTNRTSLFITSDKYLLEPGVEYAWRVRAFTDGELTLFQNGGYSEVFSFVYGSLCPDPENVHAEVLGPERAKVLWDADPVHTAFEARFRKKGDSRGIWHTREVFVPSCEIGRVLEAGTSYEYQVKAKTPTAESGYSTLQYFTTPLPANESFECGKQDSVTVTDQVPMVSLGPGDIIYSGEFPIKITQVQGGNGVFSGKGRMRVPFLSNIQVNMVFTGIRVNELGQVYGGKLESVYNPDSKVYIDDVTDYWSVGDQVGNIVTGQEAAQIEVGYTIGSETQVNVAYNDKNNTVTVTGPGGTTTTATIPTKTGGTTIVDAEGKLFAVDTSGHVAEIGQSGNNSPEEYAALVSAYNNLDGENTIGFSNAEKETWAFDQWQETYQGKELIEKEYENLNGYKVPWKLVPAGKYGKIYAKVTKGNIDISKLVFKTPTGTEYKATKKGKGVEITVMGSAHGDGQEIFALYPKGDSTLISLGKVKVASYDMLVRKLFIVPIDKLDANINGIKTGTSGIFLPLGVEWDIQLSQPFLDNSWDLDGDGLLDAGESGMLGMYTGEMKALNKAYAAKNKIDPEAIYVFVLQGSTGSTGMLLGDMPISSKFGYIFSPKGKKITAKTVAHEVAHGMFQLRHTFNEDYALEKGTTDNLMDYTDGTVLFKQQWDAMYDEQALLFAWLQDEEEGQSPMLATQDQYITRLIELFRCAYASGGNFSLPTPAYRFFFKDEIGAEIELGGENYMVHVKFNNDINNFQPVKKVWDKDTYDGLPSLSFTDFTIYLKEGKLNIFNEYIYPQKAVYQEYTGQVAKDIKSLIASGKVGEAVDRLFETSNCAIDNLTFDEKFALINYIAGLAYQEDRIDYTLNEIMSSVSGSVEESEKFIEKASIKLLCNLYVGTDDENTRELFMNRLIEIFANKWKGKEIALDDSRKYLTKNWLGYYTASETEIERGIVNFGFSVWSVKSEGEAEKEFVPCGPMEPVALVEYAKSPGEEDVVTYVPAIYLRHMEMVNRDENMKEFFVLAAKITATLSSAGLVYRGATAVQKIIGIVELANTITNEVLKDPTVRAKIAARPNGVAFLEAWPTISTVTDLATISVSTLDLFSKSGKQILADCYDNIPEAERLYIKSKIDDCDRILSKGSNIDFTKLDIPSTLQHIKYRDITNLKRRDIVGMHDAVEFAKLRQARAIGNSDFKFPVGKTLDEIEEIVILAKRNHPTIPGVKIVEYRIPASDGKFTKTINGKDVNLGYTTGGMKGNGSKNYTKTIYDPSIWTDEKLEKAIKEVIEDASNKDGTFQNGKLYLGKTKEGYEMEFWYRDDNVETIYFK